MQMFISIILIASLVHLSAAGPKEEAAQKSFLHKLEKVKKLIAKASELLEKSHSEDPKPANAPTSALANKMKTDGQALKTLGDKLPESFGKMPADKKEQVGNELSTLFGEMMQPLKDLVKDVEQKAKERETDPAAIDPIHTESHLDSDSGHSCPAGIEAVNSVLDEKLGKIERLLESGEQGNAEDSNATTTTHVTRPKRSPKKGNNTNNGKSEKKLKWRQRKQWKYISATVLLPLHIVGLAICATGTLLIFIFGPSVEFFIGIIPWLLGELFVVIGAEIERLLLPEETGNKFYVKYKGMNKRLWAYIKSQSIMLHD